MDSLTVPTKALIMSMSGTALISSFSLAGMSACLGNNSTAYNGHMDRISVTAYKEGRLASTQAF